MPRCFSTYGGDHRPYRGSDRVKNRANTVFEVGERWVWPALARGINTAGGILVPDEFERVIIDLREE